MTFSDIVQLVRKETGLGYAAAAKVVDEAIEPQIKQECVKARIEEVEQAKFYHTNAKSHEYLPFRLAQLQEGKQ